MIALQGQPLVLLAAPRVCFGLSQSRVTARQRTPIMLDASGSTSIGPEFAEPIRLVRTSGYGRGLSSGFARRPSSETVRHNRVVKQTLAIWRILTQPMVI